MLGLMGENQCLLPPLILFYTIALFPQTKITNLLSSNSMFADDEKIERYEVRPEMLGLKLFDLERVLHSEVI